MPDLTRVHLETFVLDPHAAGEDEVKAMAHELISARWQVSELKERIDNGMAANREERIARDELRVMNSDLRARIAELEGVMAELTEPHLCGGEDEDGYCLTYGSSAEGRCPHARAAELREVRP
jgi:hypothetical protein